MNLYNYYLIGTCSGACSTSGTEYNGNCYYYVSSGKTQTAAEQYCIDTYGGHLASIHSSGEYDFLQTLRV